MHIFWAKISGYIHYVYCLHEESTHFGLKVSINFDMELSVQFGPKNHTRKIDKSLRTYFLFQNFSIPPNHILPICTKSIHFPPDFILIFVTKIVSITFFSSSDIIYSFLSLMRKQTMRKQMRKRNR